MEPKKIDKVTVAIFDDTCGNLIQNHATIKDKSVKTCTIFEKFHSNTNKIHLFFVPISQFVYKNGPTWIQPLNGG